MDSGDGGEFAMGTVKLEELSDVDIAHAVAIGHHKRVATDVVGEAFETSARIGLQSGVDEMDGPILSAKVLAKDIAVGDLDGEVAIDEGVVDEVAFDGFAF